MVSCGRGSPRAQSGRIRRVPPLRHIRSGRPRRPCRLPPVARSSGAFHAGCWRGHRCHSDQPPRDRRVTPVLLNRDTAEGIANGTITLVLRRWDAPRAKPGGTQRTVAGTVRIDDVAEHPGGYRVTAAQASAAGYPDAKTARRELDRRPAKHTYLIAVSYLTTDQRPELAADYLPS